MKRERTESLFYVDEGSSEQYVNFIRLTTFDIRNQQQQQEKENISTRITDHRNHILFHSKEPLARYRHHLANTRVQQQTKQQRDNARKREAISNGSRRIATTRRHRKTRCKPRERCRRLHFEGSCTVIKGQPILPSIFTTQAA